VHDPAELARLWTSISRAYGLATLDLETLIREGLYSAGVPGEVLDAVDPTSTWAVELDYPLRAFSGRSWAYVPAKAKQPQALAEALAEWLEMDEKSDGLWHVDESAEASEAELIYARSLPVDQRNEGSYLALQPHGVTFGFRAEAAEKPRTPRPAQADELVLAEFEGFATAIPDLLEEFDQSMHAESRGDWTEAFEALDRVYLSIGRADSGRSLDLELGAEGRLAALDPGALGPARSGVTGVSKLLPAGALAAVTMSWGDPTTWAEALRAGTQGPMASPLEREFGVWSDGLFDQVVEDAAFAVYVNERGEHSFVVALPGLSARRMEESASAFTKLVDRTLRSHDASLVAREAAGELSAEDMAKLRMPYSKTRVKVRAQGKVDGIRVKLTDDLLDTANVIADERGRVSMSAFEYGGAFFFVIGPGLDSFTASLGRSELADMEGLRAAHARHGGCQLCGVVNTKRSAASLFGRHKRGMTLAKQKEVRALIPRTQGGGQSSLSLRVEPNHARLFYSMDLSLGAGKDGPDKAWEAFMQALGARGETLSDPRQWLFGRR
jgi:hypothetical protein